MNCYVKLICICGHKKSDHTRYVALGKNTRPRTDNCMWLNCPCNDFTEWDEYI